MASPVYRQIAEDLRAQIASGDLAAGSQLSAELVLRQRYSASRNTARDAIKQLTHLGLVETRPGQGTFASGEVDPFVITRTAGVTGSGGGEDDLYRSEIKAGSRKFAVSPVQVEIQLASGQVASVLRIAPSSGVISRHERRFIDSRPWSMQTSHYPIPADGRIPVYEISRAAFDGNGRPIRLTITVYPVDRNQFVINVGNVPGVKSQDSTGIQPPGAKIRPTRLNPLHRSCEERESGQNPAPP
jgi:GntR family transcriptional regulator